MISTILNASIVQKEMPVKTLAYIRHVGPYMGDPELFERLFRRVSAWAGPRGLLSNPATEAITVYHDDPDLVPSEEQRISVGFTVPATTEPDGEIQILTIAAGEYVVGSFEIEPDEYGEAWEMVMDWLAEHQLKCCEGMFYESYRNDPRNHPEGKHIVDIVVPAAPL